MVAIQGQLRKVGIEVKPQPVEFNTWLDRLRKGQFDLSFTAWAGSADPDNVSYTTFHSTGSRNLNGYRNAAVDDLLEQARRAQTPAERTRHYGEFQKMVAEEAPYCFLYHQQRWYAFGKELPGLRVPRRLGRGHPVAPQGVDRQAEPGAPEGEGGPVLDVVLEGGS